MQEAALRLGTAEKMGDRDKVEGQRQGRKIETRKEDRDKEGGQRRGRRTEGGGERRGRRTEKEGTEEGRGQRRSRREKREEDRQEEGRQRRGKRREEERERMNVNQLKDLQAFSTVESKASTNWSTLYLICHHLPVLVSTHPEVYIKPEHI